jgi:hypothetical protein
MPQGSFELTRAQERPSRPLRGASERGVVLSLATIQPAAALSFPPAHGEKGDERQFVAAPGPGVAPGRRSPRMIIPSTSFLITFLTGAPSAFRSD